MQATGCAPSEFTGSSRGIVATEPLEAGTVFLRVPAHLLLICEENVPDNEAALRPAARLALRLLREASSTESQWAPYLRSLPTFYTDGASWSEASVAQLAVASAVSRFNALRDERRDDWRAAAGALACLPPRLRGYGAWSAAASAVATRTVSVPGHAAGALCPVGDLANHEVAADGTPLGRGALDSSGTFFCFSTCVDVSPGAELCVTYGEHSNLDLLAFYGFTPAGCNPHDTYPLSPHLFPELPHLSASECCVTPDGQPGWALLAALRLKCSPPSLRRAAGASAPCGLPVDDASEAAAWGHLRAAAAASLVVLERDTASLVCDGDTASNEQRRKREVEHRRLACQWRESHVRSLAAALVIAEKRVANLSQRGLPSLVRIQR